MACRGFIIEFDPNDRKDESFFRKFCYQITMTAKEFRARTLEEFDVIGMVDNTGCIRILIIDPYIHRLAQPQVNRFDYAAVPESELQA